MTDIKKYLSYKYQGSGEILHMLFKSGCTDSTNIQECNVEVFRKRLSTENCSTENSLKRLNRVTPLNYT